MAKRPPLPKYNTPIGTARYPHLNKPDTRFDDEGVYKCDVLLEADAPETIELIAYLEGIRDAKFDELEAKKQKSYSKADVYEVDLDDAGDETGLLIFKTKLKAVGHNDKGETWNNEPKLFDSQGNPLPEDTQVWSGSKLIVAGKVMAYAMGSTKSVGVSLKCDGVQVIELVSGGNQTASSFGFGKVDGGFESDTMGKLIRESGGLSQDDPTDDDGEDEF